MVSSWRNAQWNLTRLLIIILGSVTLALCVVGFYRNIPAVHPKPVIGDFGTYYSAALVQRREPDNLYDFAAQERVAQQNGMPGVGIGYIYLPFFAVLLQPFTLLELDTASRVWLGLNVIALLASAHLLLKLARLDARPLFTVIAFGLALIFPPVVSDLIYGNVNILLLLMLTAATYLLDSSHPGSSWQDGAQSSPQQSSLANERYVNHSVLARRREILAGLLIGVSISFKFYPALVLIPIAAARHWRVIVSSLAGVAAMLAVGLISASGSANTVRYISGGAPPFIIPWEPFNQSLIGALRRIFEPRLYTFPVLGLDNLIEVQAEPILDAPVLVTPVFILLVLVVVCITLFFFRRTSKAVPLRLNLALFLTMALVISPLLWEYYAVLLLLPFAIWLSFKERFQTSLLTITFVTFLLTVHRFWKPLALFGVPFWLLSFGLLAIIISWGYTLYVSNRLSGAE